MFSQLYDFNLLACAVATVSAAVGYRYTRRRRAGTSRAFVLGAGRCAPARRRSSDASNVSTDTCGRASLDAACPAPQPTGDAAARGSLKRKHREDDAASHSNSSDDDGEAGLSAALSSEPPRKRCRTPPENNEQPADTGPSAASDDPPMDPAHATSPPARGADELMAQDGAGPPPIAPGKDNPAGLAFSIPACKPSDAFAAFAGASSAFSTTAQIGAQKPAWCSPAPSADEAPAARPAAAAPCLEPAAADNTERAARVPASTDDTWTPSAVAALAGEAPGGDDPLVAHAFAKSTHVGTTGEEDEDVQAELRGVRLFVKRGTADFSTGMIGHVKLLAHRTEGRARIVFRREPVWKVSMCVGLRPAVRCSFDEDQGVLRIALKETVVESAEETRPAASREPQVVLYALKRGRVARDEFAAFARGVVRARGP